MKIKNKFIIPVLLLFLISCSTKEKTSDWLIGEWGIYASFSGSTRIQCNACPKIKFKENGNAELTYPDQEKEFYTWKKQNDQLMLIFKSEIKDRRYFHKEKFRIEKDDGTTVAHGISLYSSIDAGYRLGNSNNSE